MPMIPELKPFGIANGKPSSKKLSPLSVPPDFLQELRASAITDDALIRDCGVYFESDARKLAKLLNHTGLLLGGGLVYPFFAADGQPDGTGTVKLRNPRTDENGKTIKYEAPSGGQRAWIPQPTRRMLSDPNARIFIAEGCKKAMALLSIGLCAISVNGIYGWTVKDDGGLAEDLLNVDWRQRVVYITFDNDGEGDEEAEKKRQRMLLSSQRLARHLLAAGAAEVYSVSLPPGEDGGKCGVDDFLLSHGSEAFHELVAASDRSIPANDSIDSINSMAPPVLGPDAYHGFVGDFLRGIAPLTEATDACILFHLLPAIGTVFGPNLRVFAGQEQPPRLYSIVVGRSARSRKGTGFYPVELLLRAAARQFWNGQQGKGGLSSGEGVIQHFTDKTEYDPESKQNIITELAEKRLYIVESEFAKVMKNCRREGNVLSHILREAWDSDGNLRTLTVEPREAYGTHLCSTGHITAEELHKNLSDIEMVNGLLNRFLWVLTIRERLLPHAAPIPQTVIEAFAARLKESFQFVEELTVRNGPHRPAPLIEFDRDAKEMWATAYEKLEEDSPGFVGAMTARGSSQVMRLALIYALLDKSETITVSHLRAALAVWQYSVTSVQLLFGKKTGGELEERIMRLLRSHPDGMLQSTMHTHLKCKAKELNPALENLLRLDRVEKIPVPAPDGTAGRKATRWKANEGSK